MVSVGAAVQSKLIAGLDEIGLINQIVSRFLLQWPTSSHFEWEVFYRKNFTKH